MAHRDFIHRVLAIRSSDPILHHIAPLGLASAARRCLVVDLDESTPSYSSRTLRDLVDTGLSALDLEARPGVAVVGNGGVSFSDAASIIDRLLEVWGRIVLRDGGAPHPFRILRIEPLLPAPFVPESADIVQATGWGQNPAGRTVLPPLRRQQIRTVLDGTIEPRWRWVRAWEQVWSRPWE